MKKKIKISTVFVYIALIATAATTIYPIFFIIISSFKDRHEYMINMFGLPSTLNLSNFNAIFMGFDIPRLMGNSFLITVTSVLVGLLINSMAAFSLTKLKYKGRAFLSRLFLFVLFVPGLVLMMPIFIIISRLNLVNSYLGIILVHIAGTIAFGTFLLVQNCKDIPDEILESARIDGAGYGKIYIRIILPMLKPTLSILAILQFLGIWNEIVFTNIILQEARFHTLTLSLMTLAGRHGTNMPIVMSGLLINVIPVLIIFVVFNKYLTRGIAMGSGK
jgi:ABC-type glycerol-3-phosphate transport system permease component